MYTSLLVAMSLGGEGVNLMCRWEIIDIVKSRVNGAVAWCSVRGIADREVPFWALVGVAACVEFLNRTLYNSVTLSIQECKWVLENR